MENLKKELYKKIKEAIVEEFKYLHIDKNSNLIISNADANYQSFAGHDIVYTINCPSLGDLGYEDEENFTLDDVEFIFEYEIENMKEKNII